jgi:tRNA (guanine37-N1)-methyltransferase
MTESLTLPSSLRMSVITLFPDMFSSFLKEGVVARATKKNILNFDVVDLRTFSDNSRRDVDDLPTGGGDGMVLMPEVCLAALNSVRTEKSRVVVLSPAGKVFDQATASRWSKESHIVFLCGRYAGFDARFEENEADEVVSLGDFVLSGGELPALCVMDAVARLVPGVLGNSLSSLQDSHSDGFLEHPQFTKPHLWRNHPTPEVLLSGDHARIKKFRRVESLKKTAQMRPDLVTLNWESLTKSERAIVTKVWKHGG